MLKKLDVTIDRLRKDLTGGASQTAREVAECLAAAAGSRIGTGDCGEKP